MFGLNRQRHCEHRYDERFGGGERFRPRRHTNRVSAAAGRIEIDNFRKTKRSDQKKCRVLDVMKKMINEIRGK